MDHMLAEQLFTLFEQSAATEMQYSSPAGSLRLVRSGGGVLPSTSAPTDAGTDVQDVQSASPAAGARAAPQQHVVCAMLSGNFYRSSAPDQPPYAEVGMVVQEGQVLGLIETMKMLNEVEADRAGRIVSFSVANAASVSVGGPLVVIEPLENCDV